MKPFQPLKLWLSQIEVHDRRTAEAICRLIPATCPFARTIDWGKVHLTIPPLCHLNPFYEEFVGLRFRALTFQAEHSNQT